MGVDVGVGVGWCGGWAGMPVGDLAIAWWQRHVETPRGMPALTSPSLPNHSYKARLGRGQ